MSPEEQKRIKRALIIRFGLYLGIKIAVAVILHRWSKSMMEEVAEAGVEPEFYTNPYTLQIGTDTLGSLVRIKT